MPPSDGKAQNESLISQRMGLIHCGAALQGPACSAEIPAAEFQRRRCCGSIFWPFHCRRSAGPGTVRILAPASTLIAVRLQPPFFIPSLFCQLSKGQSHLKNCKGEQGKTQSLAWCMSGRHDEYDFVVVALSPGQSHQLQRQT